MLKKDHKCKQVVYYQVRKGRFYFSETTIENPNILVWHRDVHDPEDRDPAPIKIEQVD